MMNSLSILFIDNYLIQLTELIQFFNTANDLKYNNNDGQDWRQLPLNTSFSSMFSESGLPELFSSDYIKDLIEEDVTDL